MTNVKPISCKNLFPEGFLSDTRIIFPHADISPVMLDLQEVRDNAGLFQSYQSSLSTPEKQILASFSLPKRQFEWLGGRVCAKVALINLLLDNEPPEPFDITIGNAPSGRPFATGSKGTEIFSKFDISISHSGDFACALASNCFCGVDLQAFSDTIIRVRERFCNEEDEKIIKRSTSIKHRIAYLTLLWAAKEAVRKASSHRLLPEFLHLRLERVEQKSSNYTFSFVHSGIEADVLCGFHKDYGLAICLTKEGYHARTP